MLYLKYVISVASPIITWVKKCDCWSNLEFLSFGLRSPKTSIHKTEIFSKMFLTKHLSVTKKVQVDLTCLATRTTAQLQDEEQQKAL